MDGRGHLDGQSTYLISPEKAPASTPSAFLVASVASKAAARALQAAQRASHSPGAKLENGGHDCTLSAEGNDRRKSRKLQWKCTFRPPRKPMVNFLSLPGLRGMLRRGGRRDGKWGRGGKRGFLYSKGRLDEGSTRITVEVRAKNGHDTKVPE